MKSICVPLIHFGVKNLNNRIYLRENMNIPEKVFVQINPPETMNISIHDNGAEVELKFSKKTLYAKIKLFDNEKGNEIKELYKKGWYFNTCGSGTVRNDYIVENYTLLSLYMDETSSFLTNKRKLLTERIIWKNLF